MAPPEFIRTGKLRVYGISPLSDIAQKSPKSDTHGFIPTDSAPHPLAGTVYTCPSAPTHCDTCARRGAAMEPIASGSFECCHIACPNRKTLTACPSATGARFDE